MVRRKIRQLAKLSFLEKDIPYETRPAKMEVKLGQVNAELGSRPSLELPVTDIDIRDSPPLLGLLIPHGDNQDESRSDA